MTVQPKGRRPSQSVSATPAVVLSTPTSGWATRKPSRSRPAQARLLLQPRRRHPLRLRLLPPLPPPSSAAPGQPFRDGASTPDDEPTPSPSESAAVLETQEDTDDGGGIPIALVVGVLALLGAIGVGAYLLNQRRNPPAI